MDVVKRLQNHNIKPSVQRIAIMNYLIEHRTHPTVDEIYTALSPSIPTLSKTTADKDDQVSFGKYAAVSPAAKLAIEQEKNKTAASASPKTLYANPGKERSRLSAKVKKAEAAVEACEEVLSKLQDELNDPAIAASYSKLQEAQKKVDAKEEELNGLMEVWEQASAELDAFEESLKG